MIAAQPITRLADQITHRLDRAHRTPRVHRFVSSPQRAELLGVVRHQSRTNVRSHS